MREKKYRVGGEKGERRDEDGRPDSGCELDSCQIVRLLGEKGWWATHNPDARLGDYSGAWSSDCQHLLYGVYEKGQQMYRGLG